MASEISSWAQFHELLVASGRAVQPLLGEALSFAIVPSSRRIIEARLVVFPSGSQWLALTHYICPLARLRLRPALVANSELPIGGLAVLGADVVLRQTLPLAGIAAAEIEQALHALGATADVLLAAARVADSELPFAYAFR